MIRLVMLALCLLSVPAFAQEVVRTISVQGEAKQKTLPDQALIHFTLESKARKLEEVKIQNDNKLRKLYEIAGELQIEKKHLKTQYAQIHPEYRYHEGKQHFDGYRANTTINITLEKIDQVGAALEKFVEAGFDQINNVSYTIKDDRPIREALQLEAIKNAKVKAEKMAAVLDMKVGKPIQISETGFQAPIIQPGMRGRAMMEAMPVDAAAGMAPPTGEQETRVIMNVSFELVE